MRLRDLSPTYRVIAGLAAGVVVLVVLASAWWFVTAPGRERQKAEQATAGQVVAGGKAESGKDAANTVADQAGRAEASEDLTRSNGDEIDKTEGAGNSVGKPLDGAGRRALCLRDAYRNTRECKRLLDVGS